MPKIKKDTFFTESGARNSASYVRYFNRLTELSTSMFEWKNLPDTIDERFLELTLFGDGFAVFFKDEEIGYLALRCMIGGTLDLYQIPTLRTAYASNGYTRELTPENSVIIWNNYLHCNSMLDVRYYSDILYELDQAIRVNAKAQKTPVFLQCEESQRLTLKNLYMKYDGNQPFIFGDKNLNPNALKVLKTDAPYVCDKLYQLKTQYWNEALTYLGISNLNIQKKERLVADEVVRNLGGTIASRYSRLEMRRKACEEINRMFGTDMYCDYREDYREADDEVMFGMDTESEHGNTMSDLAIDLRTN